MHVALFVSDGSVGASLRTTQGRIVADSGPRPSIKSALLALQDAMLILRSSGTDGGSCAAGTALISKLLRRLDISRSHVTPPIPVPKQP